MFPKISNPGSPKGAYLINSLKAAAAAVLLSASLSSQNDPIAIDGLFADWYSVAVYAEDYTDDVHDWDMEALKVAHDDTYLYMYFFFSDDEHLMQDWNDIRLFIDLDNDTTSGASINGMGADIEWCFGCREGFYIHAGGQETIWQNDLQLRMMPTITDTQFEIAIGLESNAMTLWNSFTPDTIQIVFYSDATGSDDQMPEDGSTVEYVIGNTTVAGLQELSLSKKSESDIRIVSYNVWSSNIVEDDYEVYFERILKALDPDIIALQEFYNTADTTELKSLISAWLPDDQWYMSGLFRDNIIVSKYPVIGESYVTESTRTMVTLLDTEEELGKNLMILNSHLACCSNNDGRQYDADQITAYLRDWIQTGSGPFTLDSETPFLHVGDLNLVGYRQQLTTLTDGDIEDESTFGSDFLPDWDTTALSDVFSVSTSERMGYTWRRDYSSYSPGKLDYILYTDSVIDTGKHFILNTLSMSEEALLANNLESGDTFSASDHLPRVLDISGIRELTAESDAPLPASFKLHPPFPNPFNASVTIRFDFRTEYQKDITLSIFDIQGRLVQTLVFGSSESGKNEITWNASGNPSGLYFAELSIGNQREIIKLVYLK